MILIEVFHSSRTQFNSFNHAKVASSKHFSFAFIDEVINVRLIGLYDKVVEFILELYLAVKNFGLLGRDSFC